MSTTKPHKYSDRVELKKDLTQYHPKLKEGIRGWTIPDKKNNPPNGLDQWAIPYVVVRFDNGVQWGIAWSSLSLKSKDQNEI